MSLAIIIGYCALVFLTVLALLWSRWPTWMKGFLVIGATVLYFYGYHTLHAIWGTPSEDRLPDRFVMLAAVVQEPTPKVPGAIFFWINALEDGRQSSLQPRAFRLPYTRDLHTRVDEALERGEDGVSQMGNAKVTKAGQGRGLSWLLPGNDEQEIIIRDMPAPQLPEK